MTENQEETYDPNEDPVVKKLLAAKSENERKVIERRAVVQSDNGTKPTDSTDGAEDADANGS